MKKQKIQNKTGNQFEFTATIDGIVTPVVIAGGGYHLVNNIERTNAINIYIRKQLIEITEIEVSDDVEVFKPAFLETPVTQSLSQSLKQEKPQIIEIPQEVKQLKIEKTQQVHKIEIIAKPIPESLSTALEKQPKTVAVSPKSKQPSEEELKAEEERNRLIEEKKAKQKDEKEKKKEKDAKEKERLKKLVEKLRKQNK